MLERITKYIAGPPPQRNVQLEAKRAEVKKQIMELVAEGIEIDGMVNIYSSHGKIYVMQAGLEDDFEVGVYLRRAEYLVNSQGLVK